MEHIGGCPQQSPTLRHFGPAAALPAKTFDQLLQDCPAVDADVSGPGDDRLFGGGDTDRLAGELGFDRCDGGSPATGDTAASCERVSNVP